MILLLIIFLQVAADPVVTPAVQATGMSDSFWNGFWTFAGIAFTGLMSLGTLFISFWNSKKINIANAKVDATNEELKVIHTKVDGGITLQLEDKEIIGKFKGAQEEREKQEIRDAGKKR